MLCDANGLFCIKPSKKAELDFYESAQAHPALLPYIPVFYGALNPGITPAAAGAGATVAASASGATLIPPSNGTDPTALPNGANPIPPSAPFASPSLSADLPASLTHPRAASPTKALLGNASPTSDLPRLAVAPAPPYGAAIAAEAHVVLGNAERGLARPNALDVKLGARLWAADAPPAKRARLDAVAAATTSGRLGFRVAGMKVWHGGADRPAPAPGAAAAASGAAVAGNRADVAEGAQGGDGPAGGYALHGKAYGRGLTADTVRGAFEAFFFVERAGVTRGMAKKIVRRFVDDLKGLRDVLAAEEGRMYSASLLFVYEGDGDVLREKFAREREMVSALGKGAERGVEGRDGAVEEEAQEGDESSDGEDGVGLPTLQVLKMIDFAHAAWTPGQGPDENVLLGIRNVIQILEEMVERH